MLIKSSSLGWKDTQSYSLAAKNLFFLSSLSTFFFSQMTEEQWRGAGGGGGVGGLEVMEEVESGLSDPEGEDEENGGSEDISDWSEQITWPEYWPVIGRDTGSETSRLLIIYSSNLTDQTRAKLLECF